MNVNSSSQPSEVIREYFLNSLNIIDSPIEDCFESNGLMIIPDATVDPRFNQIPMVISDPHIRFYAGVPVAVVVGVHIGVLCLFNRKTKILSVSYVVVVICK